MSENSETLIVYIEKFSSFQTLETAKELLEVNLKW